MQPVQFGAADRFLAGLYHAPAGGYSQRAFLLCNPIGQEAIRAYRCYRELALKLSGNGAHVFRFDYSGCGDSWGEADDGGVAQWVEDIRTAALELVDTAATDRVTVIGARMGATLAYLASASLPGLDRMILWDPIVDGRACLERAAEAHRVMLGDPNRFPRPREAGEAHGELLGFEMPQALVREIESIDLCATEPATHAGVHVLASAESPELEAFAEHLRRSGCDCDYAVVPSDTRWEDGTELERTLLVPRIVDAIVERVGL